ncbi:hypothetical protein [Myroides sp. LoEW2-1]|uniref:hypothetical protein n=1 Tax=Myroides sp. LoEW2-1 TaxID=2683192 RepID=UPI00132342F0|nr:hypothetical protein [Myroides sp. LoEW2-1]MVX35866.1 hypothetical protein [Myroides sp. LoEW2-1]
MKREYVLINSIFAALLAILFGYISILAFTDISGINIRSSCEGMPIQYCRSRGLTRDFISIMQKGYSQTIYINPYSQRIFTFFIYAFVTRILSTIVLQWFTSKKVFILDITVLTLLFAYAFFPLLLG